MTFDDVIGDERLFAVRYVGDDDNILYKLFDEWNDIQFLKVFFERNLSNLKYFKVYSIETAIDDTMEDSGYLEEVLLDINLSTDLDFLFEPIGEIESAHSILIENKAIRKERKRHDSWLRIYAIKLEEGIYIITGGAIKLTKKMQQAEHTREELKKLERCRNYLSDNGVYDKVSFTEFILNN